MLIDGPRLVFVCCAYIRAYLINTSYLYLVRMGFILPYANNLQGHIN